ncbi:MAG: electron transport complex subunit RsxA [Defluviitaleaceae bacterium]|nr:electron transport complex subunit RsxA [Defluviitaleaceae bacterium]MCL2837031.1 electron transport complex subunit RsxA [Defluviitaleaceae bacterium]
MNVFVVFVSAVLVNNFVLSRFLGICPFLGVSRKLETAVGMGLAVTFVMALSSAVTYIVYYGLLVRYELEYLYNIAFILIIASLVQLVEMFLKRSSPSLYKALGVYLPLITTNCAVLGVAVINIREEGFTLFHAVINGIGGAAGFTLALILFAGIRERIEFNSIPKAFRGFPIALIAAGLMSVVFLGFRGIL